MGWNSFTEIMDLINAALEQNAALASFCSSSFRKNLTVRKGVKRREEIAEHELPIVMGTVPSLMPSYATGRLIYREYTIRLYCGFKQDDRAKAPDQAIKFEELIEQAILNDAALNGEALQSEPGNSANDEGFFHPVYFIAKEFRVLVERDI